MNDIYSKKSNTLIYKIIIGILVLLLLILGISFINNKGDSYSNEVTSDSELLSENETLKEEKEKLLSQIDELDKNIETLEEKVKELSKEDTTDLEKEISTLKNQITALNSSVSTLKSDKDNLNNEIANYKSTIDTLNSTITELNNKITTLTNENNTLKEEKETYTVFYSANNETIYSERVKKGDNVKNIPSIPEKDGYESEWSNDGKNIQGDMVIYAKYYYLITFTGIEDVATLNRTTYKMYENASNKTLSFDYDNIKIGEDTIVEATIIDKKYESNGWKIDGVRYALDNTYDVVGNTEIEFYASYGCIAKGSKISMADGTTKKVENIKSGDKVLSYDYYTGTISETKVITLISDKSYAKVFNVKLANGNELKIVDDEYLFDTDAKEFIKININTYKSSIGKNVMVNNNGSISSSKIVSITYKKQEIEHYTMYTEKSVNYIANNIIALAPVYYTNIRYTFDNNYKVDMEKYTADVNKYGVYSYSDFEDVCTKETFDNFVLKDYKAVVEKGYVSFDEFKSGIKILQEEIDYYNSINK